MGCGGVSLAWMITRRRIIALSTAAIAGARAIGQAHAQASYDRQAHAQDWPSRFVRLIVPLAPGGPTDFVGRLVAEPLSRMWGQQVVVENKPGAGGNLAKRSRAPIRTAARCCSPHPLWRSIAVSTARSATIRLPISHLLPTSPVSRSTC